MAYKFDLLRVQQQLNQINVDRKRLAEKEYRLTLRLVELLCPMPSGFINGLIFIDTSGTITEKWIAQDRYSVMAKWKAFYNTRCIFPDFNAKRLRESATKLSWTDPNDGHKWSVVIEYQFIKDVVEQE